MTDIKIGDTVRVTRDVISEHVGKAGKVVELDSLESMYPYLVEFGPGDSDWVQGVTKLVDAEALKVGDSVEIVSYRTYDNSYEGLRGRLLQIDDDDRPYLVDTETEGTVWAAEVRKVDADAGRVALVEKAKTLLSDSNPTAADIVRLAEFLAERA